MMVKDFLKTAMVFTAAAVILFLTGVPRATAGALISGVHADKGVLRAGETVAFSFHLALDAQIKARVYDPDGLAVKLLFDGHKPAGNCVFIWDGRDDGGNIVADEAYFIGIEATGPGGKTDAYHADAISGGERIDPFMERKKKQDGTYAFSYLLQHPARVCIRAGIHAGPLMKTIVDWKPQTAGPHVITWDGKDDTGRFNVMSMKNAFVSMMAYALPENGVIVSSGNTDYRKYHLALSAQTQNGISRTRRLYRSSSSDNISTEFSGGSISNQSPTFTVTVDGVQPGDGGSVNVSGTIDLTIAIDEDYIEIFNQGRYEIVVFIDAQRFDEEENGFSPYVYHLDTTRFSPGPHLLTINEVGIDGQAGSCSLTLNVEN